MMRAASEGALMAEAEVALMAEAGTAVGVTVGAVRISREAGGPSAHTTERHEGGGEGGGGGGGPRLANYLPPRSSVLCKHMSTRKVRGYTLAAVVFPTLLVHLQGAPKAHLPLHHMDEFLCFTFREACSAQMPCDTRCCCCGVWRLSDLLCCCDV